MASVFAYRTELSLYHLLFSPGSDLDDALVVLFSGPTDSKNMLPGRNVGQNYPAGPANARLSLIVYIHLGIGRGHDNKARQA